jgi:uncharacterized protein
VAKLIMLLAIIAVAWWLIKRHLRSIAKKTDNTAPPSEDMVRCVRCGVHLPRSEGFAVDGKTYCSEEHARLAG